MSERIKRYIELCEAGIVSFTNNQMSEVLADVAAIEAERDLLARNVALRIKWESVTTDFTIERQNPTGKFAERQAEMHRVLDLLNELEGQTEDFESVKAARAALTPRKHRSNPRGSPQKEEWTTQPGPFSKS